MTARVNRREEILKYLGFRVCLKSDFTLEQTDTNRRIFFPAIGLGHLVLFEHL